MNRNNNKDVLVYRQHDSDLGEYWQSANGIYYCPDTQVGNVYAFEDIPEDAVYLGTVHEHKSRVVAERWLPVLPDGINLLWGETLGAGIYSLKEWHNTNGNVTYTQ